jgi:hypothetical protein
MTPPEGSIRVWWIPQVPGEPFNTVVPDLRTARLLCGTLARYDMFQVKQGIKPDYANVGGIAVFRDGEWEADQLIGMGLNPDGSVPHGR